MSQDPSSHLVIPPCPEGDSIQVRFWKRERYQLSCRGWALFPGIHVQSHFTPRNIDLAYKRGPSSSPSTTNVQPPPLRLCCRAYVHVPSPIYSFPLMRCVLEQQANTRAPRGQPWPYREETEKKAWSCEREKERNSAQEYCTV